MKFLFPVFSEINYLGLFWCTLLIIILHPQLVIDVVTDDARSLIYIFAIAYISFRMLTRHKFSDSTKPWITFTYYGFLAFVCGMSLLSQLDAPATGGNFRQLNIILTSIYLGVSGIRFMASALIFRTESVRFQSFLNQRFSEEQYSWPSFVTLGVICLIALGIISENYQAIETVLLLTYAYSLTVYKSVLSRFSYFRGQSEPVKV